MSTPTKLKPSVVMAVTGGVESVLYIGTDAAKATAAKKEARGSHEVIWSSINGRGWDRWKGKVSAPAAAPRKIARKKTSD